MSLESISWLTHIAWLVALDGEDDGGDEDGDEEDERDCHQQESPLQPTSLVPPGDLQDGDVNYPNKDVNRKFIPFLSSSALPSPQRGVSC